MLKLNNITKDYLMKDQEPVHALRGINLNFRRSEFVAVLGPSGCGKTTLLNIAGGLDRYTDGDLIIEGTSTKDFKSSDWDTYRNHSVGFVFQSYNLIMHINVLQNVELALTIGGVNKNERKERAKEVLKTVGLEGLERKKPNQLSGGQQQRVAIARALINNPEILLADEPTGALDSDTSVQIMELLKEVAKDRLVIMVTHNPDLASTYANRIVEMKDGLITSDSNPYEGESLEELNKHKEEKANSIAMSGKKNKSKMSILTSFGLSWNNLMTKKGRTFLTAFAGSIGIIGIALVLSVSFGFNNYIGSVEKDTLARYPISVKRKSSDYAALLETFASTMLTSSFKPSFPHEVGENSRTSDLVRQLVNSQSESDTEALKQWFETEEVQDKYSQYLDTVRYEYFTGLTVYSHESEKSDEIRRVYPLDLSYGDYEGKTIKIEGHEVPESMVVNELCKTLEAQGMTTLFDIFSELIPSKEYIHGEADKYSQILTEQYDTVYGRMPEKKEEVVIILNKYNCLSDYMLFGLGLKSPQHMVESLVKSYVNAEVDIVEDVPFRSTYEEMCKLKFYMPFSYQTYQNYGSGENYLFQRKSKDDATFINEVKESLELEVVGILKPKTNVTIEAIEGAVGYLPSLADYLVEMHNNDAKYLPGYYTANDNVIIAQKARTEWDVLEGKAFTESQFDYEHNAETIGIADKDKPEGIYFYPKHFESKKYINKCIDEYNDLKRAEETQNFLDEKGVASVDDLSEEDRVLLDARIDKVTVRTVDNAGAILSTVEIIIQAVTYVLVAFVSISLIVSSIMIGIITYVSVLERTKEIGVLRSLGARKSDVANVFNAETVIIGGAAGILGVVIALLIDLPVGLLISYFAKISLTVVVPWYGIVFLPLISVILTIISGLIPAQSASKKDPVLALRSE